MAVATWLSLKTGDTNPGHVAVLIGIETTGAEIPFQAQNLDRPFIGFFYPENAYPCWRVDMLPAAEFDRKYPAFEAR